MYTTKNTLNSLINSAGTSKYTSPCMTTSFPPVGRSDTDAPEENFLPISIYGSTYEHITVHIQIHKII